MAGVPSLLVAIESRMGPVLRQRVSAEDVLQDVLLEAWRRRGSIIWRGERPLRSWLLTLVDHRLADLADHHAALKRGGPGITGGRGAREERAPTPPPAGRSPPEPWPQDHHAHNEPLSHLARSTTPSRIAAHREEADIMLRALDGVPEECREIVRLRLFDELPTSTIADRLGLGESAVRHRFRRGAAAYRQELQRHLGSRTHPSLDSLRSRVLDSASQGAEGRGEATGPC